MLLTDDPFTVFSNFGNWTVPTVFTEQQSLHTTMTKSRSPMAATIINWATTRLTKMINGPVLPVLAIAVALFPVFFWTIQRIDGLHLAFTTVGRSVFAIDISEGAVRLLLPALGAATGAGLAAPIAIRHRIIGSLGAQAALATLSSLLLTSQWCDPMAAITVGLLAASILFSASWFIESWSGAGPRHAVERFWAKLVPDQPRVTGARFTQVSMALYFVLVGAVTLVGGVPRDQHVEVLAFIGVGFTAAAGISDRVSVKSALSIAGGAIALWGSYSEMAGALAETTNDVTARTVLFAAVIVIYGPFTTLVLSSTNLVRLLFGPVLLGVTATCATFLVTSLPAVVIFDGCSTPQGASAVFLLVLGSLSAVAGLGVAATVGCLVIRDWRTRARQQRSGGRDNHA